MNIFFRSKFLYAAILFHFSLNSFSQVNGCTDPLANNYNPSATNNNGSCTYTISNYVPVIKVDPISDSLIESSGLQIAANALWSFNDGGGSATLYRIDTLTNSLQQTLRLAGATNVDWEDIAFDGTYLYIGDFGNNYNGGRADLKIYKIPISAIPDYHSNPNVIIPSQQISVINFIYADQVQPPVSGASNNTKFDCEAMIIDNDKIHLFSKNWIDNNSTHYIINSTLAGNYIAIPVETLATNFLVTAADKIAGQNLVVLMGYQNTGLGNHYLQILSDYTGEKYFNGNKRPIDLPNATVMGQAEGICFATGKTGYISNEKFTYPAGPFTISVNQKLRSFNIENLVATFYTTYQFIGDGNWSDTSNWANHIKPPTNIYSGNQIIINPITGGNCILDIPYTIPTGALLNVKDNKQFLIRGNLNLQ